MEQLASLLQHQRQQESEIIYLVIIHLRETWSNRFILLRQYSTSLQSTSYITSSISLYGMVSSNLRSMAFFVHRNICPSFQLTYSSHSRKKNFTSSLLHFSVVCHKLGQNWINEHLQTPRNAIQISGSWTDHPSIQIIIAAITVMLSRWSRYVGYLHNQWSHIQYCTQKTKTQITKTFFRHLLSFIRPVDSSENSVRIEFQSKNLWNFEKKNAAQRRTDLPS